MCIPPAVLTLARRVFLSPALRKQVVRVWCDPGRGVFADTSQIVSEKLAFPSGTATAQLISVLHGAPPATERHARKRRGYQALSGADAADEVDAAGTARSGETDSVLRESLDSDGTDAEDIREDERTAQAVRRQGWTALGYSFAASAAMTLSAYFVPVLFALPLFGQYFAREWLWTFTPSLSYVGQGVIMGFPTTLSMAAGALVGWGVLSPLAKNAGWAPGPTGDMSTGARGWILWTALGIMCADALVGLAPVVGSYAASRFGSLSGAPSDEEAEEVETEDRLVPMRWVTWALAGSVVIGVVLIWWVFGEAPWATFIGFIAGSLLSVLG
jgi:uncharacterized oligopeptide transporter (OPT) family protein